MFKMITAYYHVPPLDKYNHTTYKEKKDVETREETLEQKVFKILDRALESEKPLDVIQQNLNTIREFFLLYAIKQFAENLKDVNSLKQINDKIYEETRRVKLPLKLRRAINRYFSQVNLNLKAIDKFNLYVEELGHTSTYLRLIDISVMLSSLFAIGMKAALIGKPNEVLDNIANNMRPLLKEFEDLSDEIVEDSFVLAFEKNSQREAMSS